MGNRKIKFVNGEFYHVYNRGVDKRDIFLDKYDIDRFLQSMIEFNRVSPTGGMYIISRLKQNRGSTSTILKSKLVEDEAKLVNVIAYCLNPNHYHFILEQVTDGGISEFMKRLNGGYTYYFNEKNERSGSLFQGRFKAVHINSNEYLLHLSSYVNLNYKVHQLSGSTANLVASSWNEYVKGTDFEVCDKNIILSQFSNKKDYAKFAEKSLKSILERREKDSNLNKILFDKN